MVFMRKVAIKVLLFNYLALPKCAATTPIIAPSEPKVINSLTYILLLTLITIEKIY